MDYLDISEIPDRIEDVIDDKSVDCETEKKDEVLTLIGKNWRDIDHRKSSMREVLRKS